MRPSPRLVVAGGAAALWLTGCNLLTSLGALPVTFCDTHADCGEGRVCGLDGRCAAPSRDDGGTRARDAGPADAASGDAAVPDDGGAALDAGDAGDAGAGDWHLPGYRLRIPVDVDGTGLAEALTGFPLSLALADQIPPGVDLDDVVFVDDDGQVLGHEIEPYAAGTPVAWVAVDLAAGATTRLWLYGDVDDTPVAHDAPWDEATLAVWHMAGPVDLGDGPGLQEATGVLDDADTFAACTGTAGPPADVPGQTGPGLSFDGIDQNCRASSANAFDVPVGGQRTWTMWMRADEVAPGYLFWKESFCTSWGFRLLGDGQLLVRTAFGNCDDPDADLLQHFSGFSVVDSAWHHFAIVYDGVADTMSLFIDGSFIASATTPSGPDLLNGGQLGFGADFTGNENPGAELDELRIVNAVRSEGWLAAEVAFAQGQDLTWGAPETR